MVVVVGCDDGTGVVVGPGIGVLLWSCERSCEVVVFCCR